MEETPQQQERIERYLRGELPEAERAQFTSELARDPALRRRVALHRDLEAAFSDPQETRLRATLRAVNADFSPGGRSRWLDKLPPNRQWWAIAATLLLLIAAGIFWLYPGGTPDPAALATAAFEPYPIDVFRSSNPNSTPAPELLDAYQAGQFGLAAERIAALPEYETTAYWPFYRAVALIGAKRGAEAIPLLRRLQETQSLPGLAEAVDWYLALALLQAQETDQATTLLQRIANSPTHYQRQEARRLLDRL